MFSSLNITSSALTAQRLRMDVISSNVANVDSTRAKYVNGNWVPYRRKMVVLETKGDQFSNLLNKAMNKGTVPSGVKVSRIVEDETPYKLVYNPDHPDANEDGYVQMPNVDPLKEMVDLINATRSYEANVTVFNASKSMLVKALDIGK